MQLTLWEDQIPKLQRKKKAQLVFSTKPYSITGANDCQILGHTLRAWDLAGCSVCLDCGVNIFCPQCITSHPYDATAIPVLCEHHEESQQVSA